MTKSHNNKIRVTHIISGLGQGGAESVMYRLLCATQDQFQHEVISFGDLDDFGPRFQEAGIPVHALGLTRRTLLTQGKKSVLDVVQTSQPDVIQTWMYHANAFAGWWLYRAGYGDKIIWNIRNSGMQRQEFSKISRLSIRLGAWLSRWVPSAIVSCAHSAVKQHQRLGFKGPNMQVIANGVDTEQWHPDEEAGQKKRTQLRIQPHMPVIGVVARWHALKDYPNLLAALAQVVKEYPNVRCLLIGSEVEQTNKSFMALLKQYELLSNVLLLGQRDDVPEWMQAMDVFVLSSKAEGFPNVVCEAMASGVRCVVTDVGDAAYIVDEYGIVVAPEDADALAQGIRQALHELGTDVHRQAVEQGPVRIASQFSLAQMVSAYTTLWQQVGESGRTHG